MLKTQIAACSEMNGRRHKVANMAAQAAARAGKAAKSLPTIAKPFETRYAAELIER